jgi:hypothetical protein
VSSIASVSGGSLANGAVAQAMDYAAADSGEVELLAGTVAAQLTRGSLFCVWRTHFYLVAVAFLAVFVAVVPWLLPIAGVLQALVLIAGFVLLGLVVAWRGRIAESAFSRTLLSSRLMRDVDSSVDHVFCAADLHAGENVYFSPRFVCSYRFGIGRPANVRLKRIVQASAAFPGAFPVSWLATAPHAFTDSYQRQAASTRWMTLVDGGVYDNMADQWAQGLQARQKRWPQASFHDADELVVASGSAGLGWRGQKRLRIPLLGGLLALLRVESVLYDNGNSVHRRELVSRFDLAAREGVGLRGALVHIEQSPFTVPRMYVEGELATRWRNEAPVLATR